VGAIPTAAAVDSVTPKYRIEGALRRKLFRTGAINDAKADIANKVLDDSE
jgi:hypothetical protein